MTGAIPNRRAGMTLIELLVVIMILGLLGVAAAPALVGNRDKKAIRGAAEAAESCFSHAAAKAMAAPNGLAVWLEAEPEGAGAGNAVTKLMFARVPAWATGSTAISNVTATSASVSLNASGLNANDLPAPIEFAGIPGVFTATSTSTVSTADSALNRTARNSAPPPASTSLVPYVIHIPPRPSSLAASTPMGDQIAIDLSASFIGLGTSASSLAGVTKLAVEYDRTGSPCAAWLYRPTAGWYRQPLTPGAPIVLAVGLRSQAGAAWLADPTEDDPGASWQSPSCRWVVVDPRNGGVRVVEAGSSKGAANAAAALTLSLAPVVEQYTNTRQGG